MENATDLKFLTVQGRIDKPVSLLSCSPKAITGSADAKKMYRVGANILTVSRLHSTVNTTGKI